MPFTHWNAQKLEDNPAWVKPLIQDPRQSRWAGSFDRNWPWCSISWGCLHRRHAMASAVNIQQYSDQYVLLNKKHSTRIITNYSLTIVYILVRLRMSSFHLILTTIRVQPWGQRRAILPCKACQIPGNEVSEFHDAWDRCDPPKTMRSNARQWWKYVANHWEVPICSHNTWSGWANFCYCYCNFIAGACWSYLYRFPPTVITKCSNTQLSSKTPPWSPASSRQKDLRECEGTLNGIYNMANGLLYRQKHTYIIYMPK